MTPQHVDGGYAHCPICNGLVRVIGRYEWGFRMSQHLAGGSLCPQTEVVTPCEAIAYHTLQFHVGGLFDGGTIEEFIHLVRQKDKGGTPGPTLCGIDRFAKDSPGWSVGGGFSGEWRPCPDCDSERHHELAVRGMHRALFAAPTKDSPVETERAP